MTTTPAQSANHHDDALGREASMREKVIIAESSCVQRLKMGDGAGQQVIHRCDRHVFVALGGKPTVQFRCSYSIYAGTLALTRNFGLVTDMLLSRGCNSIREVGNVYYCTRLQWIET